MGIRTYIRSCEIRWLLVSLLVIVLLAAMVNVPFAMTKIRSRTAARPADSLRYDGPEAAQRGWPSRTPHDVAWAAPNYRLEWSGFAYREFDVRSPSPEAGVNGFSMTSQRLGWPLPAVELKQMWWDWDDPALEGPEPDPRPQLVPLGVVANPLLVGVPLWVLLFGLPYLIVLARRIVRARRGRCAWCGFEMGDSELCPECGRTRSGMLGS